MAAIQCLLERIQDKQTTLAGSDDQSSPNRNSGPVTRNGKLQYAFPFSINISLPKCRSNCQLVEHVRALSALLSWLAGMARRVGSQLTTRSSGVQILVGISSALWQHQGCLLFLYPAFFLVALSCTEDSRQKLLSELVSRLIPSHLLPNIIRKRSRRLCFWAAVCSMP